MKMVMVRLAEKIRSRQAEEEWQASLKVLGLRDNSITISVIVHFPFQIRLQGITTRYFNAIHPKPV